MGYCYGVTLLEAKVSRCDYKPQFTLGCGYLCSMLSNHLPLYRNFKMESIICLRIRHAQLMRQRHLRDMMNVERPPLVHQTMLKLLINLKLCQCFAFQRLHSLYQQTKYQCRLRCMFCVPCCLIICHYEEITKWNPLPLNVRYYGKHKMHS